MENPWLQKSQTHMGVDADPRWDLAMDRGIYIFKKNIAKHFITVNLI